MLCVSVVYCLSVCVRECDEERARKYECDEGFLSQCHECRSDMIASQFHMSCWSDCTREGSVAYFCMRCGHTTATDDVR